MPSMLSPSSQSFWKRQMVRVMSALPLCSAYCLHVAAAGGAGDGAVPAAFCKTLEVAAAEEMRRMTERVNVLLALTGEKKLKLLQLTKTNKITKTLRKHFC